MSTVKISELTESQAINDETMFEISILLDGVLVSRSVKFGTIKNALDGAGVTSFNGRAGTVEPEAGDYSADQVSFGSASVKDELERLENEKVDKEAGKGLSTNDFTDDDAQKLDGIEEEANKTEVVQGAGDSSTAVMSQGATTDALASKVDKEPGKGLSTNDFTNSLKTKLEGLEGTHWRGVFPSKAALESGASNPVAGDYADVDAGVGHDTERYIWDASDNKWVVQASATSITAAQVKQMYESNPDTNAFTDAEKTKLSGIAIGATNNPSGAMGSTILTRDSASQVREDLELKSAALRDVGTGNGEVLTVGNAFGLGGTVTDLGAADGSSSTPCGFYRAGEFMRPNGQAASAYFLKLNYANRYGFDLAALPNGRDFIVRGYNIDGEVETNAYLIHSENLRSSTGSSTVYPMSQAATSDAINESLKSQNHIYAQKTVAADAYEVSEDDNGHIVFFTSDTGVDVSFASVSSPVNCVLVQAGDGAVELIDAVVSLDDATTTRGKGAAVSLVYNVDGDFWWAGGGFE